MPEARRFGTQEPKPGVMAGRPLGTQVKALPTPTAGSMERASTTRHGSPSLGMVAGVCEAPEHSAKDLLPTPNVLDKDFEDPGKAGQRRAHGKQMHLAHVIGEEVDQDLLPTPTAWEQRSDPDVDDRNLLPLAAQRIEAAQGSDLLPTPTVCDEKGRTGSNQLRLYDVIERDGLLPTPAVNDMGAGKDPDEFDEWRHRQKSAAGTRAVHGRSLDVEARKLPTPRASDAKGRLKGGAKPGISPQLEDATGLLPTPKASNNENAPGTDRSGVEFSRNLGQTIDKDLPTPTATMGAGNSPDEKNVSLTDVTERRAEVSSTDWGPYTAAIRRWEAIMGRPAPAPTIPAGKNGEPRLNPALTEWMMGLPEGFVVDVPGLSRNAQLKACGNGVVPAQAAAALIVMVLDEDDFDEGGRDVAA